MRELGSNPPSINRRNTNMLNRMKKKAFTMVELIVVIVILGVLAALTVPAFTSVINKSKQEVAVQEASAVAREARAMAAFDGGRTTLTSADFQQDMNKTETGAQSASGSAPWTYTSASNIAVSIDANGTATLAA